MNDPNFPVNLDIHPLHLQPTSDSSTSTSIEDIWKQRDAIKQYGIAGRICHALLEYFTPSSTLFSPPCSIFNNAKKNTIIELGSGQSVASLHLAAQLDKADTLVLTDLPNVVPLMQQSVDTWKQTHNDGASPVAEPLGWGTDIDHLKKYGEISHVVCCDLVYFPNLYPPLMRTLLQLTDTAPETDDEEVFGAEVILAYKSRTLNLEQSFFDTLALYFRLEPVLGGRTEAKIYTCRRWRVTEDWLVPEEKDVMNGSKEVIRGRGGMSVMEEMLGAIEWD